MNQTEERERFEIKDEASANWYLRKLRNLENEKDTIKAQAAAMLKALDTEIHSLEFRFGPQFETFVRGELDRCGARSKTLPLFQGTASFRTVPASLRVRNVTEAIEHARAQGWDGGDAGRGPLQERGGGSAAGNRRAASRHRADGGARELHDPLRGGQRCSR